MVQLTRKTFLGAAVCACMAPALRANASRAALPSAVAGVSLPQSDLARGAVDLAQRVFPDFLFNHCMRTYVFGALALQKQGATFNADEAFTAATLHDLGLMPAYASANGSFETDGARAAETFARQNGADATAAAVIWHGVAMHDTRFARRQGPEAMVVALGAGADVNGPGSDFTAQEVAAIIAAFPRLQFKAHFTALLVDQCRRKPLPQAGTWLEGLCREVSPAAWPAHEEQSIAESDFAE
jgi:hypothetical protein